MSDEDTPKVLDYLREQFARLNVRLDNIDRTLQEHTTRLARLEREVANLHANVANLHGDFATHSARFDGIDARLDRIERRLDLVDAK